MHIKVRLEAHRINDLTALQATANRSPWNGFPANSVRVSGFSVNRVADYLEGTVDLECDISGAADSISVAPTELGGDIKLFRVYKQAEFAPVLGEAPELFGA